MVDNIAIENLVGALKSDKKDNQSAYMAVVTKKDNDGTVWVQIAGSNIETPVEATSADVKNGDAVTVEWRNNRLYISGNTSNPSAGVSRVISVENAARVANEAASNAVADAGVARQAAESAQADAEAVGQAVTTVNNNLKSVVQGATTVEKAVSVMQTAIEAVVDYDPQNDTVDEYFWHDANGAHVLGTSGDYRADIKSTGMNIVDTLTENAVATFGTETSIKTSDGTELAHFGYDLGTTQGGTAIAPYYTFGRRVPAEDIYDDTETYGAGQLVLYGNPQRMYVCLKSPTTGHAPSDTEYWQLANGNYSCAEGRNVIASGEFSHAEGSSTIALRNMAHAEGYNTAAEGYASHAEGYNAIASAPYSHAQNRDTLAGYEAQTVIGKFNSNRPEHAFEIGNGTAINARSNALTVAWDGNVEIALDTSASSGTDHDIYAALTALGWASDVIV